MPTNPHPPVRSRRLRAWLLHLCRWSLFAALLWLIRDQHAWRAKQQDAGSRAAVELDRVLSFFPRAAGFSEFHRDHDGQTVVDDQDDPLGFVVQTSPQSDDVVGYSGPTNTLIAFDTESRVLGLAVLSCGDTQDHLQAVLEDANFLHTFDGLNWQQARAYRNVDGVTGATLTSMAIVEGVQRRLGGAPHSYRFPRPVSIDEVRSHFPRAAELVDAERRPGMLRVLAAGGAQLGAVARTSPTADDLIGFQGPTDTLIILDTQDRVQGMAIRATYENEEYVRWVREDDTFMNILNGRSLDELVGLDLFEAGIEGVSGATMTSMSMAHAVVETAGRLQETVPLQKELRPVFASADLGTLLVITFGLLMGFTSLRSKRPLRIAFQLLVIVYLGLLHGEMVSQAVLVGWTRNGVAWRSAPALVVLVAAALLVPLTTCKQIYCHQLCPHGAAQQLIRNLLPWKLHVRGWVARLLFCLPALLLAWVLVVALLALPFNLASIEPFDAYVFRVAGWASLTIAIVGLVCSLFIPLAYCRFGCPTGALLNYLRLHGRADRLTLRDATALGLLALAIGMVWWSR